jgi:hypothetical protein
MLSPARPFIKTLVVTAGTAERGKATQGSGRAKATVATRFSCVTSLGQDVLQRGVSTRDADSDRRDSNRDLRSERFRGLLGWDWIYRGGLRSDSPTAGVNQV